MQKNYRLFHSFLFIFCIIGSFFIFPLQVEASEKSKIKVLATTFPMYDWLREIVGDSKNIEIDILLKSGVDLHSYQPTIQDIANIAKSDIFIYNGGESDAWVSDVLKQNINKQQTVVNLMSNIGNNVKLEEIVEGMEPHNHDHHNHDHGEHEHTGHDHESSHNHNHHNHDHTDHGHSHSHDDINLHYGYDEHIWLSLENAQIIVKNISVLLGHHDKENIKIYRTNAQAYIKKLQTLDDKYKKAIESSQTKTILVADRFPFRYLVDDYGIDYFAAFVGCSADTEASFETVVFLSKKVDELNFDNIFIIDGSSDTLAKSILSASNKKQSNILVLNSLQSVKAEDISNNISYFSIMQENLETLKQALAK